jgi:hypothetical protein
MAIGGASLVRPLDPTDLYVAHIEPELVGVPSQVFVMIDGHGDPNTSQEYREAVEALYSISYTLKFGLKRELGLIHRVAPLEGLWWCDDMAVFATGDRSAWSWRMMIAQPAAVTSDRYAATHWDLTRRKALPGLNRARLEPFEEGLAGQVLHVGPYSAEGPTIARLHAFILAHGLRFDGSRHKHHEIYLGDPRRSAPDRLRTIIRQPVDPA